MNEEKNYNIISEDILDDIYDCLLTLNEIKELEDLKCTPELEILDRAYNIIKHLYENYSA